jgi:hypothetical protein
MRLLYGFDGRIVISNIKIANGVLRLVGCEDVIAGENVLVVRRPFPTSPKWPFVPSSLRHFLNLMKRGELSFVIRSFFREILGLHGLHIVLFLLGLSDL